MKQQKKNRQPNARELRAAERGQENADEVYRILEQLKRERYVNKSKS